MEIDLNILEDLGCQKHKSLKIVSMCTYASCEHRLLCQKCDNTHNLLHRNFINSISDIAELDLTSKLAEISDFSSVCLSEHSKVLKYLSTKLDDIRKSFELVIEKMKNQITKEISKLLPDSFFVENLRTRISKLSQEVQKLSKQKSAKSPASVANEQSGYIIDILEKIQNFTSMKEAWTRQKKDIMKQLDDFSDSLEQSLIEVSSVMVPRIDLAPNSAINEIRIDNLRVSCKLEYEKSIFPNGICYIDDQDLVVVGLDDGRLILLGHEMTEIQAGNSAVTCVKYSKSQKLIITAHSTEMVIRFFKLNDDGTVFKLKTLYEHDDEVWSILVLDKLGWCLSAGDDDKIIFWDLKTQRKLARLDTYGKESVRANMIYIEKDGVLCVGFYEGVIITYDLFSRNPINIVQTYQEREHLLCMTYMESSGILVVGLGEYHVQLWKFDKSTMKLKREIKLTEDTPRSFVAINRETCLLISNFMHGLSLVNLKDCDRVDETKEIIMEETTAMIWISKRKQFVVGTWKGEVLFLDYGSHT